MVLEKGSIVTLDTNCLIYYFENHPIYANPLEGLFTGIQNGEFQAILSVISILEILVKPKKDGNVFLQNRYKVLLFNFPNMDIHNVDPSVADLGASLRAKYGIKTPDAIIVATALLSGSDYLVSNDVELANVCKAENIQPVCLGELGGKK